MESHLFNTLDSNSQCLEQYNLLNNYDFSQFRYLSFFIACLSKRTLSRKQKCLLFCAPVSITSPSPIHSSTLVGKLPLAQRPLELSQYGKFSSP